MIEEILFVGRLCENCMSRMNQVRVIRIGSLTFPFCDENSFHEWNNEIDLGSKKLSLIFRNEIFQ